MLTLSELYVLKSNIPSSVGKTDSENASLIKTSTIAARQLKWLSLRQTPLQLKQYVGSVSKAKPRKPFQIRLQALKLRLETAPLFAKCRAGYKSAFLTLRIKAGIYSHFGDCLTPLTAIILIWRKPKKWQVRTYMSMDQNQMRNCCFSSPNLFAAHFITLKMPFVICDNGASAQNEITLIMDSMSYFLQVIPRDGLPAEGEVQGYTLKPDVNPEDMVNVWQGHP